MGQTLSTLRTNFLGHRGPGLCIQVIRGLPGIGKTQTAVEYVYQNLSSYRWVLWAAAASSEVLTSEYLALANELELPERREGDQRLIVAAVKRWLGKERDWLLVLDNVDEVSLVAHFLPRTGPGHVLLTTQGPTGGVIDKPVPLEEMEPAEGALLLLRRVGLLSEGQPLEEAPAEDRAAAEAIAGEMDGLPLAMDHAGAYLLAEALAAKKRAQAVRDRGAAEAPRAPDP